MIWTLSQVALGGALGAALRYLTNLGALRLVGPGFPAGTMTVNVLGCLAMGALAAFLAHKGAMRLAPFLMTGVLGGYTTFSAFALDAVNLWDRGQTAVAVAYVLGAVLLSLAALMAGLHLMRGVLA
ncbi:MAG: fluoride efflux transporter CrcB [Rhodobacterales bacterium]|nr:fluoride efflux transporter CrcB [Rhodobacterales bacterium]